MSLIDTIKAATLGHHSLEPEKMAEKLSTYLSLLHKWNKAYNLTAIRDIDAMILRHLKDSLSIMPFIKGSHLIDVGTGAGLPGLVIAIAKPDIRMTLLDSNGKKTRFLQEVKRVLALSNIEIIQSRAERYHPEARFDTVISRAFSDLEDLILWTTQMVAVNGIWLAMKGVYPESELSKIHYPYRVETYKVEGLDGERCAVIIEKDR